jgi:hypothetical protein
MRDIRVYVRELKRSNKGKRNYEKEFRQKSHEKILKGFPVGEDPATGLIGLGNSKQGDISDKHDSYLANYKTKRKT